MLNETGCWYMREAIRDRGRLLHMRDAILRIFSYTDGKTKEEFLSNDMMYYAIVKNIEIIGEASYMLTSEFKDAHPQTPWKLITCMRHYMVHGYYQIDKNVVWDVVTGDLSPLKRQLDEISRRGFLTLIKTLGCASFDTPLLFFSVFSVRIVYFFVYFLPFCITIPLYAWFTL